MEYMSTYPGVVCFSKLLEVLSIPLTGFRWIGVVDVSALFDAIIVRNVQINVYNFPYYSANRKKIEASNYNSC